MKNWKTRLLALNEAMGGIEPGQIAEGLNPLELVGAVGSGVDSVTGAPMRAGIGSAITGGTLDEMQEAYERQFGANPQLAPSFGLIEDALLDPSNLLAASPKMAARLAALGEVGAVGEWGPKFKQVANPALEQEIRKLRELVASNMSEKFDERTLHRNIAIETQK